MNRGTKAASVMFLYAAIMVAGGLIAYSLAPETANATTALIVPVACAGVMVLCAILALQVERIRGLGMTGYWLGVVFTLMFAAVIGMRATKVGPAIDEFHAADAAYVAAVGDGSVVDSPEARTAFFAERDAPDHSKAYLRNTLAVLSLASAGAFVLLLTRRPAANA